MKNKLTNIQSQQKDQEKSLDIKAFSTISLKILPILDAIIKYSNKYSIVCPTQETLCWDADVTRQTVNRHCQNFERMGILTMLHRRDPDDPYHKSLTNIYKLNEIFFNQEFRKLYENILPALKIIPLLLILSTSVTQILKSNYINKCDIVTNVTTNKQTARTLYETRHPLDELTWNTLYGGEERSPTKQLDYTYRDMSPFVDLLCDYVRKEAEKEKRMEFTPEELSQLSQFSKQTLDYARDIVRRDEQNGKQISNPFKYFYGICERYKQKNPSTGKTAASSRPQYGPQSVYKHVERELETDYEFAYNVENKLHQWRLSRPEDWRYAKQYPNPKLKLLSVQEQQQVMAVHEDCSCRQTVDNSLQRLGQIVTKPHDLEMRFAIPLSGNSTEQQPPETILPTEPMNSFDEQYTPLVDAMYEGYEECLD